MNFKIVWTYYVDFTYVNLSKIEFWAWERFLNDESLVSNQKFDMDIFYCAPSADKEEDKKRSATTGFPCYKVKIRVLSVICQKNIDLHCCCLLAKKQSGYNEKNKIWSSLLPSGFLLGKQVKLSGRELSCKVMNT